MQEVAITSNSTLSSRRAYAEAGVDIDAGNALVDAIKPLAKATARLPGPTPSLGGFGGRFLTLKQPDYRDPILVSAPPTGSAPKLKIAIETGRHDTIGIDLVATVCVNDLIVQGAEPLLFLDYFLPPASWMSKPPNASSQA